MTHITSAVKRLSKDLPFTVNFFPKFYKIYFDIKNIWISLNLWAYCTLINIYLYAYVCKHSCFTQIGGT